jgi:hypothetical protein
LHLIPVPMSWRYQVDRYTRCPVTTLN